jgi:hypothetical protein
MRCQAYLINTRAYADSRERVNSKGTEDGRFDANSLLGKEFKKCDELVIIYSQ